MIILASYYLKENDYGASVYFEGIGVRMCRLTNLEGVNCETDRIQGA